MVGIEVDKRRSTRVNRIVLDRTKRTDRSDEDMTSHWNGRSMARKKDDKGSSVGANNDQIKQNVIILDRR